MTKIRVLAVIPYSKSASSMIFVHRQLDCIESSSQVDIRNFLLESRTSLSIIGREAVRFRKEVVDFRPDIVHAHFGTMTSLFCAILTRKPLVITFRGSDLNPAYGASKLRNRIRHWLSQLSALRADSIICVSQQIAEQLWWARERIEIIPSGVSLDLFRPLPKKTARTALGWNDEVYVVLFNASNDPGGKGLLIAEEAIRRAQHSLGRIQLVVLHGDVPPDRMPFYYNATDCLLLASEWEGSPNVVKEAMACNLPVVSSRVGDVEERLQGVFPSKVTERNAKDLGEALVEVLLLHRRSNGRERIAELSLEYVTERLLSVYRRSVGKN
jgi:glycosyltransferase involved in cell wall biosynthesis